MSKVFTIAEGLENMGALKTGGQGSVYKAKRTGTIITAVKLLPTPIMSESLSDKSYTDFKNEVEKLKRVNEEPNPNVVKILSSGITETGSFPFIEMEFIEGPDLEELLKAPHEPIFTIKEAIKVAEHLSHAIAHCHKADVKHGDVKSNNVKLNIHTGNYMLLDFGLAVMNDEERRTSLRQAGAIEFMAPEQANGDMLLQSDIYSFGVILFELLAGRVPFPLTDKSESARNMTMVAHLESPPPDLASLRRDHLPASWEEEKKAREQNIPQWLLAMVYRCLEKAPEKRFDNGQALYQYVLQHSANPTDPTGGDGSQLSEEHAALRSENEKLRQLLLEKGRPSAGNAAAVSTQRQIWIATTVIAGLIAILILVIALKNPVPDKTPTTIEETNGSKYIVMSKKAYFHNEADEATRRNAYLIPSKEIISAQKEENGFVYVVFTNPEGQTSKGWIRKKDLKPVSDNTPQVSRPLTIEGIRQQLKEARRLLSSGSTGQAVAIYATLAEENVPEAMYQYGNLALQNKNPGVDCPEAIKWISQAVEQGYTPAKKTLGFLYLYGEDAGRIRQYEYERCRFQENHRKGSKLLMDAALDGDTSAQRLLNEFREQD